MNRPLTRIAITWILAVAVLAVSPQILVAQSRTPARIRKLMSHLEANTSRSSLAKAFLYGSQHVDELIIALDDPDPRVRLNAQRVIRYLGDPQGMRALFDSEEAKAVFVGIIPAPLSEWDYARIEKDILCDVCALRSPMLNYFYALAIDGSPRAQEMLVRIKLKAKPLLLFGNPTKLAGSNSKELSKNLIDRAFYLDNDDKSMATARLVARTKGDQMALYEIHVNHGALEEKWFHVVLVRDDASWRYLSVSLAGQS